MLSLDELQIGQTGRISKLDMNSAGSARLMEMGLTVGTSVKVLKFAPLRDPIEILVRGYHLSLRRSEARSVFVESLVSQ